MTSYGKPLYVVGNNASLRLDGASLRVLQPNKSDARIPLRRVSRAIIQPHEKDQLQACLAIIRQGGTVHFLDPAGRVCAMLQQPSVDGTRWARDLAAAIEGHATTRPYHAWRKTQQRHAWSLVFRRGFCGDFRSNRKRLIRYLSFYQPQLDLDHEIQWLEDQLLAWLHAQIATEGLHPVVRAINARGERLVATLQPCLSIPLLWAYVRWRRTEPTAMVAERTAFFELQAAAPLHGQFQRHIRALATEYHAANGVKARLSDDLSMP